MLWTGQDRDALYGHVTAAPSTYTFHTVDSPSLARRDDLLPYNGMVELYLRRCCFVRLGQHADATLYRLYLRVGLCCIGVTFFVPLHYYSLCPLCLTRRLFFLHFAFLYIRLRWYTHTHVFGIFARRALYCYAHAAPRGAAFFALVTALAAAFTFAFFCGGYLHAAHVVTAAIHGWCHGILHAGVHCARALLDPVLPDYAIDVPSPYCSLTCLLHSAGGGRRRSGCEHHPFPRYTEFCGRFHTYLHTTSHTHTLPHHPPDVAGGTYTSSDVDSYHHHDFLLRVCRQLALLPHLSGRTGRLLQMAGVGWTWFVRWLGSLLDPLFTLSISPD